MTCSQCAKGRWEDLHGGDFDWLTHHLKMGRSVQRCVTCRQFAFGADRCRCEHGGNYEGGAYRWDIESAAKRAVETDRASVVWSVAIGVTALGEWAREQSANQATEARIAAFTGLQQGWDSYDAPPVDAACVEFAMAAERALRTRPSVCPTLDGGVSFEYDRENEFVRIELRPGGAAEASIGSADKGWTLDALECAACVLGLTALGEWAARCALYQSAAASVPSDLGGLMALVHGYGVLSRQAETARERLYWILMKQEALEQFARRGGTIVGGTDR